MAFFERIREYREQLEITQMEASRRLGIDHSVLSKYERGDLSVPIELLSKFLEVYRIPEKEFLEMIIGTRLKSKNPGLEARESRERYLESFLEEYVSPLIPLKEFRELVIDVATVSDEKERRRLLQNKRKNN
ncbi:helix-turn-helix transcriptional regulator [Psychrobacillus sp. OK032]|uniref:helix-turn-helix domain-containing protein n=1 Tax=Psychrobacillus sp. OK032 TaxID=1884358 RepID=UPI0008B3E2EE|nr:helix-turn-helix transcriptional regulator [Psychrobacillus sp. OK032]SES03751.1 Helix-turn-helix [Psychrobacillus sp. OK032]